MPILLDFAPSDRSFDAALAEDARATRPTRPSCFRVDQCDATTFGVIPIWWKRNA
jgi:hypothetical protein